MQGETGVRNRTAGVISTQFPVTAVKGIATLPRNIGQAAEEVVELLSPVADPMVAANGKGRMQFGDWWRAFLWAPYDRPNYPFKWMPYLITLFHVFVLATVMGTVIPNIASLSTSTSTGLNAITVAVVTATILLIGMSIRSADFLPQLMHPALAFIEWIHGHLGVVVALPMIALMLAGGALRLGSRWVSRV